MNAAKHGRWLLTGWKQHAPGFMLLLVAMAWPWELFQQIPGTATTLVKIGGAGLILLAAAEWMIHGRSAMPRTGFEGPIILFLGICSASTFWSLDPAATRAQLWMYFSYFLLFYATATFVRAETAAPLYRAFALSAILAGLLAIACAAGWLNPVIIGSTHYVGRHIPSVARSGPLLRMAATSPDFNQGVLTPLIALPVVLFLGIGGKGRSRYFINTIAALMLMAAMVIAFSRSSLMIAAVLVSACLLLEAKRTMRWPVLLAALFLLTLIVAIAGHAYWLALIRRFMSGFGVRDASYASRWYGFTVAASLLPHYGWYGTGLAASDIAIRAAADPARLAGATLHSVPFKFLLELGVIGCTAYFWFWIKGIRVTWKALVAHTSQSQQPLGLTMLGMAFAIFCILAVQPFTSLSVFPFLFGIMAGALTRHPEAISPTAAPRHWAYAGSMAAIVMIVIPNILLYQSVSHRASTYGDALDQALAAELRGDYPEASSAYQSAYDLAKGETGARDTVSIPALESAHYYPIAAQVAGLPPLYVQARMSLSPGQHSTASAAYGLARSLFAQGQFTDAATWFAVAEEDAPDNAEIPFARGEALWKDGQFAQAADAYIRAASRAPHSENESYRRTIMQLQQRANALRERQSPGTVIESAWHLLRQGNLVHAQSLCREASQADVSVSAEARQYCEAILSISLESSPEAK